MEDLIPNQEVIVTLSSRGYIKRQPVDTYRRQGRGGRGITGMVTRETDAVYQLLIADTHDHLLFFTDRGRVFSLRVHEVPDASRIARGIPLINLVAQDQEERVTAIVATPGFTNDVMLLITKMGEIKKTALSDFAVVRRSGLIAMGLDAGDELIAARLANEADDVLLITTRGQAIRFPVRSLRLASRSSGGVRGIKLGGPEDAVVGVVSAPPVTRVEVLVVTENGLGKRTLLSQYPTHRRGGQGVSTYKITDKTGRVVAARKVAGDEELMIISAGGIVLRTSIESIALLGRSTQGVMVMRPVPNDHVAAIAALEPKIDAAEPAPEEPPVKGSGSSGTKAKDTKK